MRLIRFLLVSVLFLLGLQGYAQYESEGDGAGFSVDQILGCVPLNINVSDNIPANQPAAYIFDADQVRNQGEIEQGNNPQRDTTYTEPGIYTIWQVTNTGVDSIQIEVLDTVDIAYQIYNCEDNGVYIDFSAENNYDRLRFDFGDGTIDTIAVSNGSFTHDYAEANQTQVIEVEGIYDGAETNCKQSTTIITTTDDLPEAEIERVQVISQDSILLQLDRGGDNIAYQVQVAQDGNDFDYASWDVLPLVDSVYITGLENTRQHYYCFRVATLNRCDPDAALNPVGISDTLCSIALQATVSNLINKLDWQNSSDDFPEFDIYRDGVLIGNTSDYSFEDSQNIQCQMLYFYQLVASYDGMTSISEQLEVNAISTDTAAAPASLSVSTSGAAAQLIWGTDDTPDATKFYIYREGGGTDFQRYDSLIVNADSTLESSLTYLDDDVETEETYCYNISYVDECGVESELSIQYCIEIPSQARVTFPNAFTPNGDGLNDVFLYQGNLIEQIELKIFNRWGELLFHTSEVGIGWDGTYQGSVVAEGVYLYEATIIDQLGNRLNMQGSLTLLIP